MLPPCLLFGSFAFIPRLCAGGGPRCVFRVTDFVTHIHTEEQVLFQRVPRVKAVVTAIVHFPIRFRLNPHSRAAGGFCGSSGGCVSFGLFTFLSTSTLNNR